MTRSQFDALEVSAAVARLIADEDDNWLPSAQVVAAVAQRLPIKGSVRVSLRFPSRDTTSEVTGYVAGRGNVTTTQRDANERRAIQFGFDHVRVGNFKIWRPTENVVKFCHYRDDMPHARIDEIVLYLLACQLESGRLRPHTLVLEGTEPWQLPRILDALVNTLHLIGWIVENTFGMLWRVVRLKKPAWKSYPDYMDEGGTSISVSVYRIMRTTRSDLHIGDVCPYRTFGRIE